MSFIVVYTCKASKIELHQSTAASTWWCGPQPSLGWVKIAVGLSEDPSYPGHSPHTNHFFAVQSLNNRRRVARSLFKIGLFSLFSCLSLARLLILLLLLMSGNVHHNPCSVFLCSVCAGNVTWRGRSVQCCTCSNWVYLKCLLLSFSRFRTLGSSHSWSCPPYCVLFFGDPTPTSTVTSSSDSSIWYTSIAQSGTSSLPSANAALAPHPRLQTSYPHSAHFVSSPSAPSPSPHVPGCFSLPPGSSSPP